MYQESLKDTIAAISTPPGQGGIGIVRISGKESLNIADKIFVAKNNKKPSSFRTYSVHYGKVFDLNKDAQIVDEALIILMKSPKSYTAEDVVEISCHGGSASLKKILSLALESGARLAQPGEFTKRAFLNGRMDLTQAEAVLDIIQAKTEAFLRTSVNQLKGELTLELESIRELLMDSYVEIEAIVNFPEDDIDASSRQGLMVRIDDAIQKVNTLLLSSDQGRIIKEGAKVVAVDPQALDRLREVFKDRISYVLDKYEAAKDADCILLTTEWDDFKDVDFKKLKEIMSLAFIVDGRNLYKHLELDSHGFLYLPFGSSALGKPVGGKKIL